VPNQCDYPLWEIIVAALALIAVFYYAIARGKGKGRTAKRTIRLGKNTQYMIFALIVIGILYYIGYLSWLLFAAVILGALYIVVKYIHIL
jgi:type IV secretory pathway VirB2 component (pilin)